MKTWNVELEWKMRAYIEVEAPSLRSAKRQALEGDVPDDGEYVEDSLKVTDAEEQTA
jgi:hypothetical protein